MTASLAPSANGHATDAPSADPARALPGRFDYASLPPGARRRAAEQKDHVNHACGRVFREMAKVGRRLADVRRRLGEERFADWLARETVFTSLGGKELMAIAAAFGRPTLTRLELPIDLIAAAALATAPAWVRDSAVNLAEACKAISAATAGRMRRGEPGPPSGATPRPRAAPAARAAVMTAAALPPRIPGQPAPAAVIAEIRRLHGEGLSSRKIGALLGMDRGAVRRWALHPDPFRPPRTKLSLEQAREIRRLKAEGKSYKSLSDLFGVSQGMIGHVLSGHAWREPGGRP